MAKTNFICTIDGCNKPAFHKTWCSAHYGRWKRNGDPLAGRTPEGSTVEFMRTVALSISTDECVRWPFGLDSKGYGRFSLNKKSIGAHQMACEHHNGPRPHAGLDAAHKCGNRWCINPRHLRWATKAENALDRVEHGTHNRGSRNAGAKLTEDQARQIKALRGTASYAQVAGMFGVSMTTVRKIMLGLKWAWLE